MKTTKPTTKPKRPKSPASNPTGSKPAASKRAMSANRSVAIQFHAPSALAVCVAGTFNDWRANAHPLSRVEGGEWRGELPLAVGRYEYLFVVDGRWIPDPAAGESVPNEFGGRNSVVFVN